MAQAGCLPDESVKDQDDGQSAIYDLVQRIAQAAFVMTVIFVCQQFAFDQNGNIGGVELRVNDGAIPNITAKAQIPFDKGR